MAISYCLPAATRLGGHGLLARLSSCVHHRLPASSSSCCSAPLLLAAISGGPRTFTRIFSSSVAGRVQAPSLSVPSSSSSTSNPPTPSSTSTSSTTTSSLSDGGRIFEIGDLPPEARPRMPLVPEERPKPTTAVTVVEAYLEKLWRDFFTNPHNWFDNRLRRRAPKYADFKNRLTKEGLWITARWNPVWVRTELSLMTNFRPVPYDDPLWAKKKAEEDEARREKPPPVPPGAWLQEELKAKRERAAAAAAAASDAVVGDGGAATCTAPSVVTSPSLSSASSAPAVGQEQQ